MIIQKAYETLMNPEKKRLYDSTLVFDEKIPTKKDFNSKNFYEVFHRVFSLNSRFSTIQPVPVLGDENTPISEVKKFYQFWDNFTTWREFSEFDEHKVADAENREEKRWMQQENATKRKAMDKEERKRIFNLTNIA